MVPCFERPQRAAIVRDALHDAGHSFVGPQACPRELIARVHTPSYLEFLSTAHERWRGEGRDGDAVPHTWPASRPGAVPDCLLGQLGYYVADAGTAIGEHTWDAVCGGADVVWAAVQQVQGGERAAMALTRPPGHHAAADLAGGYCLLNFAAIAAEAFRGEGTGRVAILDVDYHHGNGTQAIFERRADVFFASIHADPHVAYPYFTGHAHERGIGGGQGTTLNLPLPQGTDGPRYAVALQRAVAAITDFDAGRLVVSLGLDPYVDDPISGFRLTTDDFAAIGRAVAAVGLPTLLVLEGGYHLDSVGRNTAAFLAGLED